MLRRVTALSLVTSLSLGVATGTAKQPQLAVSPATGLLDAPLIVDVRGVRPTRELVLEASTSDAEGRVWTARTPYVRRRQNVTGLLWRMLPRGYHGRPDDVGFRVPRTQVVTITLLARGRRVARSRAVRLAAAAEVTVRDVGLADAGFVGRLCTGPEATRPAVLRLGGSEGGMPGDTMCILLASKGYPTLNLAYFGMPGLPARLEEIPLEYFARALAWLRARTARDTVVIGHSRGGEAALLVGATYPELVGAVAGYVPSAYVHPAPGPSGDRPAWTLGGVPLPFLRRSGPTDEVAAIRVENVRGPIFAVGGGQDLLWPSLAFVQTIATRMHTHGRRDVTALGYVDAGHGVGAALPNLHLATRFESLRFGGTSAADARARNDAWPKLLRFLRGVALQDANASR
jgi:dienelactone hydrolase